MRLLKASLYMLGSAQLLQAGREICIRELSLSAHRQMHKDDPDRAASEKATQAKKCRIGDLLLSTTLGPNPQKSMCWELLVETAHTPACRWRVRVRCVRSCWSR